MSEEEEGGMEEGLFASAKVGGYGGGVWVSGWRKGVAGGRRGTEEGWEGCGGIGEDWKGAKVEGGGCKGIEDWRGVKVEGEGKEKEGRGGRATPSSRRRSTQPSRSAWNWWSTCKKHISTS